MWNADKRCNTKDFTSPHWEVPEFGLGEDVRGGKGGGKSGAKLFAACWLVNV